MKEFLKLMLLFVGAGIVFYLETPEPQPREYDLNKVYCIDSLCNGQIPRDVYPYD